MRRRFNAGEPAQSDDLSNLTKYEEKYIIPTDNASVAGYGAPKSGYGVPSADPSYSTYGTSGAVKTEIPTAPESARQAPPVGAAPASVQTGERPMVFALRSDSNVYIYEYSDRLEYYRNTPNGMLLCNIENKRR